MQAAWAVSLKSDNYSRIFCVFASSESEAFGKALSELKKMLEKDNKENEKVSDYRPIMWTWANIPDQTGVAQNTSSFDDQIKQIM